MNRKRTLITSSFLVLVIGSGIGWDVSSTGATGSHSTVAVQQAAVALARTDATPTLSPTEITNRAAAEGQVASLLAPTGGTVSSVEIKRTTWGSLEPTVPTLQQSGLLGYASSTQVYVVVDSGSFAIDEPAPGQT